MGQRSRRGSTSVFMLAVVAVAVLAVGRFAMIQFHASEMETAISTFLLQNRQKTDDAALQKEIVNLLGVSGCTVLVPNQVRIFRNALSGSILVRASYTEPMHLPYTEVGFDWEIHLIVEESLR